MSPRAAAVLLAAALALAAPQPFALSTDRDQPIFIEADSVEIDDAQGFSVYRGNVVYTQGTLRMEADTVHVFHTADRNISRLEAVGSPVRFRQRLDGHDEDLRGQALRVEYFAEPERMVLEREAHIWRLNTEFSGEFISYDPAREVVEAGPGRTDAGRVQIVIQPRRDQDGPGGGEEGAR